MKTVSEANKTSPLTDYRGRFGYRPYREAMERLLSKQIKKTGRPQDRSL